MFPTNQTCLTDRRPLTSESRDLNRIFGWQVPLQESGPTDLLQGQLRIPHFAHANDFVTFKMHDVDVVSAHALSSRWDRAPMTRVGSMEYRIHRYIVPCFIDREGF